MCYYVPRIKCQRISKKIILHLVMLPSEINLKGHESVLKWSKGGRKRKENKRSHFADVYFAPSLQHNLWLHLAWREISEKKKEKSYFSACLGCQGLFNSGSRQLSRFSTANIWILHFVTEIILTDIFISCDSDTLVASMVLLSWCMHDAWYMMNIKSSTE